jgi:hypothetical protein
MSGVGRRAEGVRRRKNRLDKIKCRRDFGRPVTASIAIRIYHRLVLLCHSILGLQIIRHKEADKEKVKLSPCFN